MLKGQLRCKDNRTDQDLVVAKLIYVFRINRATGVSKTTVKKESRFYLKPVFAVKADDIEALKRLLIQSKS